MQYITIVIALLCLNVSFAETKMKYYAGIGMDRNHHFLIDYECAQLGAIQMYDKASFGFGYKHCQFEKDANFVAIEAKYRFRNYAFAGFETSKEVRGGRSRLNCVTLGLMDSRDRYEIEIAYLNCDNSNNPSQKDLDFARAGIKFFFN